MKIEMLKVPIMLDIIEEALDSNYSVVVFVNYIDTMWHLAHYFETDSIIYGKQTMEERQESINNFQSNKTKIIICIIQAGGVGISLHDTMGGHPRMSVISPTWSGQDMQQALGRIHRAGSKSPAMQRIVFCAETYEEAICELIQKKMTNISGINDRDLIGPRFTEELYEEIGNEIGNKIGNKIGDEIGDEIGDDNDNDIADYDHDIHGNQSDLNDHIVLSNPSNHIVLSNPNNPSDQSDQSNLSDQSDCDEQSIASSQDNSIDTKSEKYTRYVKNNSNEKISVKNTNNKKFKRIVAKADKRIFIKKKSTD